MRDGPAVIVRIVDDAKSDQAEGDLRRPLRLLGFALTWDILFFASVGGRFKHVSRGFEGCAEIFLDIVHGARGPEEGRNEVGVSPNAILQSW